MWIPGHKNIYGNDQADILAKNAYNLPDSIEESKIIPHDLFPSFKTKMINDSAYTYCHYFAPDKSLKGEKFVLNSENFKTKPWFQNIGLTRQQITYINRIRSGHVQLKYHLNRMNILNDSICDCGQEQENLNHKVWRCSLIDEDQRNLFFNYVLKNNLNIGEDVQTFAIKENIFHVVRLIKFLTESKIFSSRTLGKRYISQLVCARKMTYCITSSSDPHGYLLYT